MISTYQTQRLVLHNDLAELKRLEGWIAGLAHRVSPGMLFAIQLCLEEAIANIIMYARAKDDLLQIAVEIECADHETLIARIEDSGLPFDPTQVPAPALAKSPQARRLLGRSGCSCLEKNCNPSISRHDASTSATF